MQVLQDDVVSSSDVSSITKTTAPQSQMVWGLGVREPDGRARRQLHRRRPRHPRELPALGLRIYPLQDANWNVRTLTGSDGTVLARIDYDEYGNWTFLTSSRLRSPHTTPTAGSTASRAGDSTHRSACTPSARGSMTRQPGGG